MAKEKETRRVGINVRLQEEALRADTKGAESVRIKIEARCAIYFNGKAVDTIKAEQFFSYDKETESCYLDSLRFRREVEKAIARAYRTKGKEKEGREMKNL